MGEYIDWGVHILVVLVYVCKMSGKVNKQSTLHQIARSNPDQLQRRVSSVANHGITKLSAWFVDAVNSGEGKSLRYGETHCDKDKCIFCIGLDYHTVCQHSAGSMIELGKLLRSSFSGLCDCDKCGKGFFDCYNFVNFAIGVYNSLIKLGGVNFKKISYSNSMVIGIVRDALADVKALHDKWMEYHNCTPNDTSSEDDEDEDEDDNGKANQVNDDEAEAGRFMQFCMEQNQLEHTIFTEKDGTFKNGLGQVVDEFGKRLH